MALNFSQILKNIRASNEIREEILINETQDTMSPNIRAIRLAINIGDKLLSMGVSANDVTTACKNITKRYCLKKVDFDILVNLIIASQDRGDTIEPLTFMRTSAGVIRKNNMIVQALHELVHDIRTTNISMNEAEKRYKHAVKKIRDYPIWLTSLGAALIGAGIGTVFSGNPLVIFITMLNVMALDHLRYMLSVRKNSSFFTVTITALMATLTATSVIWLGERFNNQTLSELDPTVVITSGIYTLVAGLAMVRAMQDAIDGFNITAGANILNVIISTTAIVCGVLGGLYIAKASGIYLPVKPALPDIQSITNQIIGMIFITTGFALSLQLRLKGVLIAATLGCSAWFIAQFLQNKGLSPAIATGFTAMLVGFSVSLVSRALRTPSAALISSAIIPLVPGFMIYSGIMQLGSHITVEAGDLATSLNPLSEAVMISISMAAGASLGVITGRMFNSQVARILTILLAKPV